MDAGPLIDSFSPPPLKRGRFLLLSGSGLALALLLLGYALHRLYFGYANYGPAAALSWSFPWFFAALLAAIAWLFLSARALIHSSRRISIHSLGLVVYFFHLSQVFPWEDISGISVDAASLPSKRYPHYIRYQSIITFSDGTFLRQQGSQNGPLRSADIQDLPALLSRLKAILYPRLLPRLSEQFQSGGWLDFGPLSIHTSGLRTGSPQQTIPWSQVSRLTVQSGRLVVELTGVPKPSRLAIPVSRIPNLELLFQLIRQGATAVSVPPQ
jgi:hypothetical protein